jgi:6-pyruvoyltetrahydropterin/6-carboxytetrahydropterin synthase
MFRLTREVRFAINQEEDPQWNSSPTNSYGGYPSLTGFGTYLTVRVTLSGQLDPRSSYLINIKEIDEAARDFMRDYVPMIYRLGPGQVLGGLYSALYELWRERFESVALCLSPTLTCEMRTSDIQLDQTMRLSQKFEFSASHRLHSPSMSDEENLKIFGKCSNAHGHGHNYELQVTLIGTPHQSGLLMDIPEFERIVSETVIEKFDHKNLNLEVPEFRERIPTVENIAQVIYLMLKPKLRWEKAKLASVTVWETPKTWCEYSE